MIAFRLVLAVLAICALDMLAIDALIDALLDEPVAVQMVRR